MAFISLTGGAYQARSLIAAAQRCLNLFPEPMPQAEDEPFRVTHYCTPGLTFQATAPQDICRGLYTAFNGDLYTVYGQQMLHYSSDGIWTSIGYIVGTEPSDATPRTNPVSMCDNGNLLILVDGSTDGYFVDLSQPVSGQVLTPINRSINQGFLGSDFITFQDTFFVLNSPGTAIYYVSLSNINAESLNAAYNVFTATLVAAGIRYTAGDVLTINGTNGAQITVNTVDAVGAITQYGVTNGGSLNSQPANPVAPSGGSGAGATFDLTYTTNVGGFDPLDFAAMTGQAGNLVAAVSIHRYLWTIGTNSYEVWINSGGDGTITGSFPFLIYPGAYGNWGCCAKYSVAWMTNQLFWLSQDKFGRGMVMRADGISAKRISTHAIEFAISAYPDLTDAVSFCYQQQGHLFYVLSFKSANGGRGATWTYDNTTGEWHERCYIDANGVEYRILPAACSAAYGKVFVGDWRNGNLYLYDTNNYTDNGMPVKRLRSFPHQIDLEANRRIMYHQLVAQMQVGSSSSSGPIQPALDCLFNATDGTLLQNYANINSLGATFGKIDAVDGVILSDSVRAQTTGDMLYLASGAPTSPDYTVQFTMQPTSYDTLPTAGDDMFVIGRANEANNGYQAAILSDGSAYSVKLLVLPGGSTVTVLMGTLSSGSYVVTLTMQSTLISVSVTRTQDSYWLNSAGVWVGSPVQAIQLTDTSYLLAGQVLLGGVWV